MTDYTVRYPGYDSIARQSQGSRGIRIMVRSSWKKNLRVVCPSHNISSTSFTESILVTTLNFQPGVVKTPCMEQFFIALLLLYCCQLAGNENHTQFCEIFCVIVHSGICQMAFTVLEDQSNFLPLCLQCVARQKTVFVCLLVCLFSHGWR